MQRTSDAARAALAFKPGGDLLPLGVELDDRAEARAGLVGGCNSLQVHFGETPHAQLSAVEPPAEVGYRGVGQLGMWKQTGQYFRPWSNTLTSGRPSRYRCRFSMKRSTRRSFS